MTNDTHSGRPVWINYEYGYGSILYNGTSGRKLDLKGHIG